MCRAGRARARVAVGWAARRWPGTCRRRSSYLALRARLLATCGCGTQTRALASSTVTAVRYSLLPYMGVACYNPSVRSRPLDFPPPFRAPIAALPAKADGGLLGACSPARSVRVRRGRRDRTPRRACRAVRLRAPLLHRLRPTRSCAGSDLKPAPAERAVLRPASARRWQAREPQRG